jgi:uncharacterized phage infection (PIP) family protein YhgE
MATVSSVSAMQYGVQQLRIQQAQRSAAQAEQNARALEAQANHARRTAARAEDDARNLEVQSGQARSAAGRVRQGLAAMESASEMQQSLGKTANVVSQKIEAQAVTPTSAPIPSVTYSSKGTAVSPNATTGQPPPAGTLVDTTA